MSGINELTGEEKKSLLSMVRKTIEAQLTNKELPVLDDFPKKYHEIGSCFVTLHNRAGMLRGCIGNITATEPLIENIRNNAINSAFHDPRFSPLASLDELNDMVIEISILTKPESIMSADEFIVGEHGIILKKGFHSAVFLPQVAPEQGWDRDTTLSHLSMKAGMPADAWKGSDVSFEVFKAIVFSEKELS